MYMPDHESLQTALVASASGDKAAFRTVFDLTNGAFHQILFKMLQDHEAARDVLQKSYLYIWQNAADFDPERGSAIAWMMVVIRSRAIDHLRKVQAERPADKLVETLVDPSIQPDAQTGQAMLKAILSNGLSMIPAKLREAVILHFIEDLSSTEIGLRLNISRHTAKSRVRRGVDALRRHIPFERLHDAI